IRHFAITGIVTASWISLILSGSDMRATPPSRRMSAGTRSSAITAQAPASSATFACSASTTSMITPPLSISARPLFTRIVPISCIGLMLAGRRPGSGDGAGNAPDDELVRVGRLFGAGPDKQRPGRVLVLAGSPDDGNGERVVGAHGHHAA